MRLLTVLLGTLCLALGPTSFSDPARRYWVQISRPDQSEIGSLVAQGFDITGVDLETQKLDILTDEQGLETLRQRFGTVTIRSLLFSTAAAQYKKPDDIGQLLEDIEKQYPGLATVKVIGQSTEGRDIYAIRLTDSFFVPNHGKPVVLFDAMHHAREVMTPEVAFDIIEYLTSRFSSDPQVQEWLRLNEVWVVPMVNPDGNNKVWTGNRMWRKNTRGGYGVDINRNYPYVWGGCNGSSGDRFDETYRGPQSSSEPETQAMMKFAREIQPVFNISYHSYSELVIYPGSCPNAPVPTAQRPIVEKTGRQMASLLKRDSGRGTFRPGYSYDLLYAVDGGSTDWMFSELGILAYAIELNSAANGFQPSYAKWRDSTIERARPGWQFILDRLSGSGIRVQTSPGEKVKLVSGTGQLIGERRSDSSGWTHFIVDPGKYRIEAQGLSPTDVNVGTGVEFVD